MRKLSIFSLALLAVFTATPALAQLDANELVNPQLTIDLQPEYPRPGEEVTASLNDYRGGTYGSSVTWVFNGEVITDAENQRNATFTAGPAGIDQEIQVVLMKPQGGREVLSRTIRPLYLDVVVEPQTRTPAFYKGRSAPSIGSMVNATALISTENGIRDSDLVYTWRLNRKVLEGGPIRGLNQVSFEMPMGNTQVLSVQVTEPNGTVLSSRSKIITSVLPEVHFYEVSTLYGMDQQVIEEDLSLIGNSVTIKGEPYNLDSRVYNNPNIAEWTVNNQPSRNIGSNPYEVTLQRTGIAGGATINFHVRDTTQVLQGAEGSIQINF